MTVPRWRHQGLIWHIRVMEFGHPLTSCSPLLFCLFVSTHSLLYTHTSIQLLPSFPSLPSFLSSSILYKEQHTPPQTKMPSFTSLAIPALYQSSRQFAPRSMAAIRQAQFASKASKPDLVTYEEIDTLIHQGNKVPLPLPLPPFSS